MDNGGPASRRHRLFRADLGRPRGQYAVPLSGHALHRPPGRNRCERAEPSSGSATTGAGHSLRGVIERAARWIGVAFVLAPWAPLKIVVAALAAIGLAHSAARGARVPRAAVLLGAAAAFWIAHVASPYWLLPSSAVGRAAALALLVLIAAPWTHLAGTELRWRPQPVPAPPCWPRFPWRPRSGRRSRRPGAARLPGGPPKRTWTRWT